MHQLMSEAMKYMKKKTKQKNKSVFPLSILRTTLLSVCRQRLLALTGGRYRSISP